MSSDVETALEEEEPVLVEEEPVLVEEEPLLVEEEEVEESLADELLSGPEDPKDRPYAWPSLLWMGLSTFLGFTAIATAFIDDPQTSVYVAGLSIAAATNGIVAEHRRDR